jgi:hypothetical protein
LASVHTGLSTSMAPRSRGLGRYRTRSFLCKLQLGPKPDARSSVRRRASPQGYNTPKSHIPYGIEPRADWLKAELAQPFFSNNPPKAVAAPGMNCQASALIPRPDGRPTWFVSVSAATRTGSRTGPSHCTPRRQIGAGEARDWPHLSGPG